MIYIQNMIWSRIVSHSSICNTSFLWEQLGREKCLPYLVSESHKHGRDIGYYLLWQIAENRMHICHLFTCIKEEPTTIWSSLFHCWAVLSIRFLLNIKMNFPLICPTAASGELRTNFLPYLYNSHSDIWKLVFSSFSQG